MRNFVLGILGVVAVGLVCSSTVRASPGKGAVAGQPCPAFSYKTIDGKRISDKSLRGKAFVIDVYSPS